MKAPDESSLVTLTQLAKLLGKTPRSLRHAPVAVRGGRGRVRGGAGRAALYDPAAVEKWLTAREVAAMSKEAARDAAAAAIARAKTYRRALLVAPNRLAVAFAEEVRSGEFARRHGLRTPEVRRAMAAAWTTAALAVRRAASEAGVEPGPLVVPQVIAALVD